MSIYYVSSEATVVIVEDVLVLVESKYVMSYFF
jgi:hypothetical protein